MNKKTTQYSIGLDIGTNSVGCAVTDNAGILLRHHSKNMWGVDLFDPGISKASRRIQRGTRRRYDRRRYRIYLLQELIGNEVLAVDEAFFHRLKNESFLSKQDKNNDLTFNPFNHHLFIGDEYNDVNYHTDYKTIYHLRKALIESDQKMDIRLIYLALHHIIKYRGNFLYEGQNFNLNSSGIKAILSELLDLLFQYYEVATEEFIDLDCLATSIIDILRRKEMQKREKQ